jgi:hypothetical protein
MLVCYCYTAWLASEEFTFCAFMVQEQAPVKHSLLSNCFLTEELDTSQAQMGAYQVYVTRYP